MLHHLKWSCRTSFEGFYLGDNEDGQLVLGGVDEQHYEGQFHFMPVAPLMQMLSAVGLLVNWPGFCLCLSNFQLWDEWMK